MTKSSATSKPSSTRSRRATKKKVVTKAIPDQVIRNTFDKIIIHHTATTRSAEYDVEWCRKHHTQKGWNDIGYHIYIEYDGAIKMGRALDQVGAHTLTQNKFGIGICYVGGYDSYEDMPVLTITEDQKSAIAQCIRELRAMSGKELPVYVHRDFKNTFCPGFDRDAFDWDTIND